MENAKQQRQEEKAANPEQILEAEALHELRQRVRQFRSDAKTALSAAKTDYQKAREAMHQLQVDSELISFVQARFRRAQPASGQPGRRSLSPGQKRP